MRRVSDGYTIIEVMIFLAISLVIATAAWNLISGKQDETDFNQKIRDTQSKMQDWINDTSTGFTNGDPQNQKCSTSTGRPLIQSGSSTTPQCIFLGKAIQFNDSGPSSGSNKVYAYSVFGCRVVGCASSPTSDEVLPTTLVGSSPKPADGKDAAGNPAGISLTETFDLSPAYVKWVCSSGPCTSKPSTPQSHLIAFYNSLNSQDKATSNGAEDIDVYKFPFVNNLPKNDISVDQCLQLLLSSACAAGASALSNYAVCLTDGSSRSAVLTITSNSGVGATTALAYKAC